MKRYLLDNGALVAYIKGRPGAVRLIRPWIMNDEAATSLLVYAEAIEYFKGNDQYERNRAAMRTLLRAVTPYRLTYPNIGVIC